MALAIPLFCDNCSALENSRNHIELLDNVVSATIWPNVLNSPCVTLMYSHGCRWYVCRGFDKESTARRRQLSHATTPHELATASGTRSNREKRWAGNVRLSHARCTLSRLYLSRPLARSRRRSYSPPVMHAHITATASWPSCYIAATAAPDVDLHLWCVPPASRCPGGSSGWRAPPGNQESALPSDYLET
jgi:hypothetical protein